MLFSFIIFSRKILAFSIPSLPESLPSLSSEAKNFNVLATFSSLAKFILAIEELVSVVTESEVESNFGEPQAITNNEAKKNIFFMFYKF